MIVSIMHSTPDRKGNSVQVNTRKSFFLCQIELFVEYKIKTGTNVYISIELIHVDLSKVKNTLIVGSSFFLFISI